jgi:hypothetical protein
MTQEDDTFTVSDDKLSSHYQYLGRRLLVQLPLLVAL